MNYLRKVLIVSLALFVLCQLAVGDSLLRRSKRQFGQRTVVEKTVIRGPGGGGFGGHNSFGGPGGFNGGRNNFGGPGGFGGRNDFGGRGGFGGQGGGLGGGRGGPTVIRERTIVQG